MFDRKDIKSFYLLAAKRTKNFLLSERCREFFIFLFFFFIAGGFWLLQTLNNDYETEFDIPIRLKDIPNNVVITSEPPEHLIIRVQDKGTVLINYWLSKTFYPISLNFDDYKSQSNHVRIPASQFEKRISSQLDASSHLLSVLPDTVEYYYSAGASKLIPVTLQGTVNAGKQYYVSDTLFKPDSVRVYAPAGVLKNLTAAYTQPVELSNISDTLKRKVPLLAPKGVKFTPDEVELTLPVDIYTEKTVDVPIYGINFPPGKTLRTFPSKVSVTFQVGLSKFRQIEASDFHILISYEELQQMQSEKYNVQLRSVPAGVSHVRLHPAQIDFLIEQVPAE
ncbi:MAG: YbbR-like domain-containing protein [Prevotellaceae bacterium]|jgi:hypothetical protein|nr:YbbR-like domain-containing protein [Prevotellaceae bacterium]